jgi:Pentapeptide repeats (8 copies)
MISRVVSHSVLACSCALLVACGASKNDKPSMTAEVGAFAARPNVNTWAPVHADILNGHLTPDADSSLVNVLATEDVPEPIFNAAAADLAQADFLTTFVLLRELNITAQHEGAAHDRALNRTAEISWLLLSLRPVDDKSSVNATNMDLTYSPNFVGQEMNLSYVDFSGAKLHGGVWRNSNLTGATFDATATSLELTCRSCSWGSVWATLHLVEGRWVSGGAAGT